MILKNQILIHCVSEKRFRVLASNSANQSLWLFDLNDPLAMPVELSLDLVENPKNFRPEAADLDVPPRLKISESAKSYRDQTYAAIKSLISSPDIFDPSARSHLIDQCFNETGLAKSTLYRLLRQWWKSGQDKQALVPNYHRRGCVVGMTSGRGRKPKYVRKIFQISAEDLLLIEQILRTKYLNSELPTLRDAHQVMRQIHYSYSDAEGHRILKEPGDYPSYRQFCYHAKKTLTREQILRSRKGDAAFELSGERAVLGSKRLATYAVGDSYEIDSTIADVFLVHHADRRKIIGKACLYIIRDTKSALIVGFYVGLEEASWTAALLAILSIFQDKQSICRRYGVPYDSNDWPAHGVMPKAFIADRGSEMLSHASTQLVDDLEVTVINLPTRRADWKPFVEIGFKQIQRSLRTITPGYTPPENFGERQTRDYSQDAALTLPEFCRLVLLAIIKQNNAPIHNYPLSQAEILSNVQPTATNLWNLGIRSRAGLLDTVAEPRVRFALLPRASAVVTREGIEFQGCYYTAPQAVERGWFTQASQGRFKKTVSFDLRSVDTLFVHDETNPEGYFTATLLQKSHRFAGLSFRELEAFTLMTRQRQVDGEHITAQLNSDFHLNSQHTIDSARALTKSLIKGKSRQSRRKDTRQDREDARRIERDQSLPSPSVSALSRIPEEIDKHDIKPPSKAIRQKFLDILDEGGSHD